MEFSQLKASIANNADETPSIYMALCMVESLLDDMEDVTGQEISDLPIGDDILPTKMVWLCQVMNQIYEEKSKELIRNRVRLDTAMRELNEVSAELETLSGTAVQLSAVKADLKQKQAAFERAKAEREEYERIKEQYRQLQLEADHLGEFDKAAEEAKLRALQAETADMIKAKSGLEAELKAASAARDEMVEQTAGLRSAIEKAAALLEQKSSALAGLEKQRLEAQSRERELTEALSSLQDTVSRLQTEKIPERRRQRDDEEARKNSLEQTLASLDLETGQLLEENQELSARIEKAKEDLKAHSSAYSYLTESYKQKNEEIAALVQRLEDLKGKTDTQKHGIYQRQMAEQIAELEKTERECAAMEETIRVNQRRAEELSRKREQSEAVARRLSEELRRLEPFASEAFLAKLERNKQRLEALETVRGNLLNTLSDMREILGEIPVDDNGAMLDSMGGTLQRLLNYTDMLQQNLVLYARNVTLEESK